MHGIYDAYRMAESPSIAASIQNTIDEFDGMTSAKADSTNRLRAAAAKTRYNIDGKRSQFDDITRGFQTSIQPSCPWTNKNFEQDFILLVEFSEIEGPKPLMTIPNHGGSNFDKSNFALEAMSVDYQSREGHGFSIVDDSQLVMSHKEQNAHSYVCILNKAKLNREYEDALKHVRHHLFRKRSLSFPVDSNYQPNVDQARSVRASQPRSSIPTLRPISDLCGSSFLITIKYVKQILMRLSRNPISLDTELRSRRLLARSQPWYNSNITDLPSANYIALSNAPSISTESDTTIFEKEEVYRTVPSGYVATINETSSNVQIANLSADLNLSVTQSYDSSNKIHPVREDENLSYMTPSENPGGLRENQILLAYYHENLVHLLYALLCGRPVVVVSCAKHGARSIVQQWINFLRKFLPEEASYPTYIYVRRKEPLKIADLAKTKLLGLIGTEVVPKAIERYVSIINCDKNVIVTPPYKGRIIYRLINKDNKWKSEKYFFAYVKSIYAEIIGKAFIYYVLFCSRLNSTTTLYEHCIDYYKSSSHFLADIDVKDSDRHIVEYFAEIIKLREDGKRCVLKYKTLDIDGIICPKLLLDMKKCAKFDL
ncbi:Smith-Magenis syndrome chromosomal region candidate gene 8 protein-like protein [Trichoplax sp. H2]|nr:Smith-Magenis syndrome chromosomal region candidate gene 8 protein-like protein [Trichoplax sp. H2]|eukprot:RDD46793.1 Smith-Magenis syndrome chromosomal region candidate gene 8 protein-like protein [Trichoplax sp. H2]